MTTIRREKNRTRSFVRTGGEQLFARFPTTFESIYFYSPGYGHTAVRKLLTGTRYRNESVTIGYRSSVRDDDDDDIFVSPIRY